MSRDEIHPEQNAGAGTFEYTEVAAEVFPGMLQRSIPGYEVSIGATRAVAQQYVQPESVAMHRERMLASGFQYVGVWLRYFNFVSRVAIR